MHAPTFFTVVIVVVIPEKLSSAVKKCCQSVVGFSSSKILSLTDPIHSLATSYLTFDEDQDESDKMHWS